jgi:hypothetical protein
MNNKNINSNSGPAAAGGGEPAVPSIVKPLAIKSTSPSNIVDSNSSGSSDGSGSVTPIMSSSLEQKAAKDVMSGFHKIIPVSDLFKRAAADDITRDFITHPKTYAFMNWIPVDRDPDYISKIFKTLHITKDATVVLKTAFDKRAAVGSRPVSRPHYIGYITIPANSIIDSVQGITFLDAIQSSKYQVILDCGDEPAQLSNWEYRVYPTKKKLLPHEVPASDLPPLGIVTITKDNAVYTSERRQGRSSYGGGFLSDNISEVSSIALSDSCANDVLNQTDNNIKFSISNAAAAASARTHSQSVKTFANVARSNCEPTIVPTIVSSEKEEGPSPSPSPFATITRQAWADMSTSDEDSHAHAHTNINITHTSAPATVSAKEKVKSKSADDAEDTSFIDGNNKLTENIKDLYEKSVAKVSSKQKLCDESYANWQSRQDSLRNAKSEQSRLQHLLDLVTGQSQNTDGDDEQDEQELCVNTGNGGVGNGIVNSASAYDNNYIIDPHSGQVTPILYYQPNEDGSYSPVLPAPSQNWYQFNTQQPHYGPPQTQYNSQNMIGQQSHHNVSTPVTTPVFTPKNAAARTISDDISRNRMNSMATATTPTTSVPDPVNIMTAPAPAPAPAPAASHYVAEEKVDANAEEGSQGNNDNDETTADVNADSGAREVTDDTTTTTMRGLKDFIDMNNITSDQLKNLFQLLESTHQD